MGMGDVEAMVSNQFLLPIAGFAALTILGIVLGGPWIRDGLQRETQGAILAS